MTDKPLNSLSTHQEPELDSNVEHEQNEQQSSNTQNESTTQETAVDVVMTDQLSNDLTNSAAEARIATKKDATLREFLGKMDEHAPIIPDAVTNYYLTLAGLPPPPATPLPLARLLALATQKFIADVAADAYQYSRIRASNAASSNPMTSLPGVAPGQFPGGPGNIGAKEGGVAEKGDKGKNANLGVQRSGFGGGQGTSQGRTVLTMEDLGMAVGEYGISVRRGEFYR